MINVVGEDILEKKWIDGSTRQVAKKTQGYSILDKGAWDIMEFLTNTDYQRPRFIA